MLAADFGCLVMDVGQSLTSSHRGRSSQAPPYMQFQETVAILIGDIEFRVTLDLTVDRQMNDQGFAELVGLTLGTTQRLFEVTGKKGFETLRLSGLSDGVNFEARWTWYSFINGVAGPCSKTVHAPGKRVEL